jgi:hypothetical protein
MNSNQHPSLLSLCPSLLSLCLSLLWLCLPLHIFKKIEFRTDWSIRYVTQYDRTDWSIQRLRTNITQCDILHNMIYYTILILQLVNKSKVSSENWSSLPSLPSSSLPSLSSLLPSLSSSFSKSVVSLSLERVPPRKRPPPMRRSHRRWMPVASSTSPRTPLLYRRHTCSCSPWNRFEYSANLNLTSVSIPVYMESPMTIPMRCAQLFSEEAWRLKSQ